MLFIMALSQIIKFLIFKAFEIQQTLPFFYFKAAIDKFIYILCLKNKILIGTIIFLVLSNVFLCFILNLIGTLCHSTSMLLLFMYITSFLCFYFNLLIGTSFIALLIGSFLILLIFFIFI